MLKSVCYGAVKCVLQGLCVKKCVWYGPVKCVLQGLCVEKCVVRCAHLERKTAKKSERETHREIEGKKRVQKRKERT